jgi:nitroreductase
MKRFFEYAVALVAAIAAVGCCSEQNNSSKEEAVIETIMTRRSVRDYKEEPVCREAMAEILKCGIYAPSALNLQPWAIRVVDSKEFIDGVTAIAVAQNPTIAEQPNFRNFFRNAPTVAFIACPVESYSGEFDCGLLSENMMLAAWSKGIGSCCLGSAVPLMNSPEALPYLERLQFPADYKLQVAIAFGYPADDFVPVAPERDETKVYYIE